MPEAIFYFKDTLLKQMPVRLCYGLNMEADGLLMITQCNTLLRIIQFTTINLYISFIFYIVKFNTFSPSSKFDIK